MPGAVAIRTGLAVAGDGDVDQLRVDRLQRFIAQAQPIHHARAELLQDDVVVTHQLLDQLHRLRPFQVQGDAALVAVEVGVAGGLAAVVGRQDTHQVGTAGGFHPQHLGAHVGQQQRGERPRQQGGEVEDFQRRQRAFHGNS
ncbi:hypothetical protein D3C85_1360110 [compost metagenome]